MKISGANCTFAVAMLAAAFVSPTALAAPFINSCGTISAPGFYMLTQNLTTAGTCLRVTADDVTLDFDGFVVRGDGATGVGLLVNGRGLTVRNGTITSFGAGIAIGAPGPIDILGAVIERMRVVNSFNFGIGGGAALVRDSVVTGNGNSGIALGQASMVINNRVVGNRSGINVGAGSTISGNIVVANTFLGISADCPSLVLGNTATGNLINLSTTGVGCRVEQNAAP